MLNAILINCSFQFFVKVLYFFDIESIFSNDCQKFLTSIEKLYITILKASILAFINKRNKIVFFVYKVIDSIFDEFKIRKHVLLV